MTLGPVSLDIAARRVTVNGSPVDLTPREYELLKVMIGQPGRLLTKGRLLRAVWGTAYADEGHYLHVYVAAAAQARRGGPTGGADGLIIAEPGIGYRIGDPAPPSVERSLSRSAPRHAVPSWARP